MKRTIMVVGLSLLLASAPTMAQMMGDEQQQQAIPQQQYCPNQMYPGMMGRYGGYGMGPGMMGGYGGYGMGPGMMRGYGGYGMGPGMMRGYGGYGMGPGKMGNYGYGLCPQCGGVQGPRFRSNEEYTNFLDQTKEQRQKLHNLMFEYNEEISSQKPDKEKLAKMEKEIDELRNEIFNYKSK